MSQDIKPFKTMCYAEMWRGYENISGGACMISAISVKDRWKN